MAKSGKTNISLPKTYFENLDFSFSGIKTAVINYNHNSKEEVNKANLAASFEAAVTEVLITNIKKAVERTEIKKIVLAGGVSANSYIRNEFDKLAIDNGLAIYYPELKLCTDNAAMIAVAGYYEYKKGTQSQLDLNAVPNLKLN